MTDLNEVIKLKMEDNRHSYKIFSESIEKKKRDTSEKVLKIKSVNDVRKVIREVMDLLVDFSSMRELDKEHERLAKELE